VNTTDCLRQLTSARDVSSCTAVLRGTAEIIPNHLKHCYHSDNCFVFNQTGLCIVMVLQIKYTFAIFVYTKGIAHLVNSDIISSVIFVLFFRPDLVWC